MIPLNLTTALAVYSAIIAGFALAIWVYTEIASQHVRRGLGKQFLWRCAFCGYTYLDEHAESVSQCPRCASYTSWEDKHARAVKPSRQRIAELAPASSEQGKNRNTSKRKRPNQRRRGPRRR